MIVNAFVLYKLNDDAKDAAHKTLPAQYSVMDFINDWLEEGDEDEASDASVDNADNAADDNDADHPSYKAHRRKWWQGPEGTAVRMNNRFHALQYAGNTYSHYSDIDGVRKRDDLRRKCMFCGERTLYYCDACMVPLCLGVCNHRFHSERTFV